MTTNIVWRDITFFRRFCRNSQNEKPDGSLIYENPDVSVPYRKKDIKNEPLSEDDIWTKIRAQAKVGNTYVFDVVSAKKDEWLGYTPNSIYEGYVIRIEDIDDPNVQIFKSQEDHYSGVLHINPADLNNAPVVELPKELHTEISKYKDNIHFSSDERNIVSQELMRFIKKNNDIS